MTRIMDSKKSERKDLGWLRDQLVELLLAAKGEGQAINHSACASYATLLYKMLEPVKGEVGTVSNLDEIRSLVMNARSGQTMAARTQDSSTSTPPA